MTAVGSLCNCGGPSPEGYHEPFCLENGITQSLDRDHPHWSFNCPQCPYVSPFHHANELAARAAYVGHLQGCGGSMRADGFTEEQARTWCRCNTGPDTSGPDQECPLHGAYVVEWATFRREVTLLESAFEPMGVSYASDEYPDEPHPVADALERAENELASIRRYDELNGRPMQLEYQLRYRLIGKWTPARA